MADTSDANINLNYGKYNLETPIEVTLPNSTPTSNQPGSTSPAPDRYISGDATVTAVGSKNGNMFWKVQYTDKNGSQIYAWVNASSFGMDSVKDQSDWYRLRDGYAKAEQDAVERGAESAEVFAAEIKSESEAYEELKTMYNLGVEGGTEIGNYKVVNYAVKNISGLDTYVRKMTRVFGLPPQWSPYVDIRILAGGSGTTGGFVVGRRYTETIMSSPTVLSLCPGRLIPSKGVKESLDITDAASAAEAMASGDIDPFWKFEENWHNHGVTNTGGAYVNCANTLCRYAVYCLSVKSNNEMEHGGEIPLYQKNVPWGSGEQYMSLDVGKFLDNGNQTELFDQTRALIDGAVAAVGNLATGQNISYGGSGGLASFYTESLTRIDKHFVHFNANGGITVGDEFNTETRQSVLEQMINGGISSIMKDVAFMVGDQAISEGVMGDLETLKSTATSALGGTVGSLINAATEIIHGGVISFPQLIDSVSWGRTFTFEVKFASMYGDVESRFLNVIMPYLCLAAFFLPRQLKNAIDMYTYPPVVRAFARGVYACDMGVLTGVSAKRGGEDNTSWTASGQPMEIDVTFTIKSLHQNLMQSDDEAWFYKNTGMQMYIGTLCGIDMTVSMAELIDLTIKAFASHVFMDMGRNISYGISTTINKIGFGSVLSNFLSWGTS